MLNGWGTAKDLWVLGGKAPREKKTISYRLIGLFRKRPASGGGCMSDVFFLSLDEIKVREKFAIDCNGIGWG